MTRVIRGVFEYLTRFKWFNKIPVKLFPRALDRTIFVYWFAGENSYILNCETIGNTQISEVLKTFNKTGFDKIIIKNNHF